VPQLYYVGNDETHKGKPHNVMIMEQLGLSLEDLFQKCGRQFDLKTTLLVGV
jgi:hypothetical protein